jgi:hypothetical protein
LPDGSRLQMREQPNRTFWNMSSPLMRARDGGELDAQELN